MSSVDEDIVVDVVSKSLHPPRKHRIFKETTSEDDPDKTDESIRCNGTTQTTTKSEKLIHYVGKDCEEIMVHTKTPCKRLVLIREARFPRRMHDVLERMSIIALRKIQTYMWPAVTKGLNVLTVGPADCGKTIGYIVPVVSSIATLKTVLYNSSVVFFVFC